MQWNPELKHFLPNVPRILVGCKADTRTDSSVVSLLKLELKSAPITYEEGLLKMDELGAIKYFECSARNGEGVKEIFDAAAKAALYPKKKITKKCLLI